MITENYIQSLYSFAYSVVNRAEQDNIRSTKCDWFNYKISAEVFHDDICRALAVDSNSKKFFAV